MDKKTDVVPSGSPEEQPQLQPPPVTENLISEQLKSLLQSTDFLNAYSQLSTPSDRIKFVLSHDVVRKMIYRFTRCSEFEANNDGKKSATKAVEFGKTGNREFEAHRYAESLAFYSNAIHYAPQDGTLLPIALGSRSGAVFQLKQYEAALKDIEAAQSHPKYSPFFMLTIRKLQCLVRLGRVSQAARLFKSINRSDLKKGEAKLYDKFRELEGDKLKDVDVEVEDDLDFKKKNIEPELLKSVTSVIKILTSKSRFESQSNNSSLSTKVEIRYDEKNGRHLATTCEVQFGDILAVTQPYASVLTSPQSLLCCHHCLTSIKIIVGRHYPRTVPCSHCTRVLYCSEHCRTESWQSYHQSECALLIVNSFDQAFINKSIGADYRLALRTLFVAGGLDSVREIVQKLDNATEEDASKSITEFNTDNLYENVYRMDFAQFDKVQENVMTIVRIALIYEWAKSKLKSTHPSIEAHPENHPEVPEIEDPQIGDADAASTASSLYDNEDIYAISTLLRHYLQIMWTGSIFVRADQSDNPTTAPYEAICTLDPVLDLVHDTCEPNITVQVVDCASTGPHVTNVCVLFAIKPIPAGTILTSVAPRYGDSVNYRLYVHDMVEARQAYWNLMRPKHLCKCECCETKRRESPFGSIITEDDYDLDADFELVYCGSDCSGLIRRTDDDGSQVKCCTCKREIDAEELSELVKIARDIGKLCSQANGFIGRMNKITEMAEQKHKLRLLPNLLRQLETLTNESIAPLALVHNRLLLIDLYKQLTAFYRYCFNELAHSNLENKFTYLQNAWKYAEASYITLETHFGGRDSLALLVLYKETLSFFAPVVGELALGLVDPVGPMVGGRYVQFRVNFNDDSEDEERNARARLVKSVYAARKRLYSLNERYNLV